MKKVVFGMIAMFCLFSSAAGLIYTGYLLDSNPDLVLSNITLCMVWTAFFCSIGLVVIGVFSFNSNKNHTKLFILSMVVTILISSVSAVFYYNEARGYTVSNGNNDYIESEWIRGNSLEVIKSILCEGEDALVYIGREECKDCGVFESNMIPILEEYSVELSAYYIDQDRNKKNDPDYDEFIKEYQIESVPCVLWVQNGHITKKWDNPSEDINEIEAAFVK